ncbi:MAG: aspartate kinase [Planctomycetota bacterium]
MSVKVCKFGGSSVADADCLRRVAGIVQSDPARRYVVTSAPGKRGPKDDKVTDLLLLCYESALRGVGRSEVMSEIANRFAAIVDGLGLDLPLADVLDGVERGIADSAERQLGPDFAASRGEAIHGRVVAALLGWPCVDAAEVVRFDGRGRLDAEATNRLLQQRLGEMSHAVVPGFYGADPTGRVWTLGRGGSDVTGSLVARAVGASVYENWTDVPGLLVTDPGVVPEAKPIRSVTYRELRELSYSGARVLHEDAVFPVREARIPVRVKSTSDPDAEGTEVLPVSEDEAPPTGYDITGVAGRNDFTIFTLEKAQMNAEVGFGRRALGVLEDRGISFEHTPSGIDTFSVVVSEEYFAEPGSRGALAEALQKAVDADTVEVHRHISLIATVGRGMRQKLGMAARLFGALAKAGVNIRLIDQGSSELNIIVGVADAQYDDAIRAIYHEFVK